MFPGIGSSPSHSHRASPSKQGRRKDSAIRTLVAETLVLAKTHGYVEKIENELEEELQNDIEPSNEHFGRWRRKGYKFFKSKYVLLAVVILCITDCALVLGELTLDLHKVKVSLEETDHLTNITRTFLVGMKRLHKEELRGKNYEDVFELLMAAVIHWNISGYGPDSPQESTTFQTLSGVMNSEKLRLKRMATYSYEEKGYKGNNSHLSEEVIHAVHGESEKSIQEEIAHAFHIASITILGIILVETIMKALCAGMFFFHRKLEVFDAFIVVASFTGDIILQNYAPYYSTRDFVFILAFLLPWRVIRVVDSLVVAVKDHEHFRLKLVYSRKKKIQNNLRDAEVRVQIFKYQCNAMKRLCLSEGLDEWKIDQCLKAEQKFQPSLGKKKCKVRIDNSTLSLINEKENLVLPSPKTSPRPSIEFPSIKFLNGHSQKHNEKNGDIQEAHDRESDNPSKN